MKTKLTLSSGLLCGGEIRSDRERRWAKFGSTDGDGNVDCWSGRNYRRLVSALPLRLVSIHCWLVCRCRGMLCCRMKGSGYSLEEKHGSIDLFERNHVRRYIKPIRKQRCKSIRPNCSSLRFGVLSLADYSRQVNFILIRNTCYMARLG